MWTISNPSILPPQPEPQSSISYIVQRRSDWLVCAYRVGLSSPPIITAVIRNCHYLPPSRPPTPKPSSILLTPSPPSTPSRIPPKPRPPRSLPTRPSTPESSKPTAARIWKSGSVRIVSRDANGAFSSHNIPDSRPHNGLSSLSACGMPLIFFLHFSIVSCTPPVSCFKPSAR